MKFLLLEIVTIFFFRFISLLGFLSVEKKKDEKNVPY